MREAEIEVTNAEVLVVFMDTVVEEEGDVKGWGVPISNVIIVVQWAMLRVIAEIPVATLMTKKKRWT